MSDIKIIALGGVRENAKNLYIVEINDSIFILDAGLKYPENEQLGVDFVIPNLDYLIENRDRFFFFLPYCYNFSNYNRNSAILFYQKHRQNFL